MRKWVLGILVLLALATGATAQIKVSVLGDSYSTYLGYVTPEKNKCFYRDSSKIKNDVHRVEDTWWWQVIDEHGFKLEVNNSYSGATVCNTGYVGNNYSDRSFVTRMKNIGKPDILFIFGGTNDSWAKSPIGEFQYSNWTKQDLFKFRPAFAYMLHYLKKTHPKMRIINICNSDLDDEVNPSMWEICKHYGVECIQLKDIDKQRDHPSILGMLQIATRLRPLFLVPALGMEEESKK